MTVRSGSRSSHRPQAWDILLALGLLASAPNALVLFFLGAWGSAHRVVPDGESISSWVVALNYAPSFLILGMAVAALYVRFKAGAAPAAILAALQLIPFVILALPVLFLAA